MTKQDTNNRQDGKDRLPTPEEFLAFTGKLLRGSAELEKRKREAKKGQQSPQNR